MNIKEGIDNRKTSKNHLKGYIFRKSNRREKPPRMSVGSRLDSAIYDT